MQAVCYLGISLQDRGDRKQCSRQVPPNRHRHRRCRMRTRLSALRLSAQAVIFFVSWARNVDDTG